MDLNTENITAWLDSQEKDFEQGLALLAAFSPTTNLVRVLKARGSSVKSLKTLSYELGKIERSKPQERTVRTVSLKQTENSTRKPVRENLEKQPDDPVLNDLVQKKNKIFKDYVAIFHQLEYMKKPQRMLAALHSLRMWDEIRDLWKQIDYYNLYRQIMPVKRNEKTANDQVSMVRRMMTIRTYLTRYEKKLATITTEKARDKWQRKLDEFNLEKQDLERKLNR
ncbi:MAG TPA: hypothetical protein PKH94_11655 [Bacteroidales bacterium]|nr:hypothetical protein [Bacteroidales bacterium]